MKSLANVLLAFLIVTAAAATASAQAAARAEKHLRAACEVAWASGSSYQIDRCTRRAMAALADENRLRDNELKRLLVESERELERCQAKLIETDEDAAEGNLAVARRKEPKRR